MNTIELNLPMPSMDEALVKNLSSIEEFNFDLIVGYKLCTLKNH